MTAKTELQLVDDGFEEMFGKIYLVFAQSYGSAKDPAEQQTAVATFQTQVRTARSTRDAAKQHLP
ncbi:hypothetical protein ABQJ54_05780 [Rhodanobacter sp. Si-c]|uniref:Uncharacterized protein n=1 Tax=Rhodanobacter lycopersici TaxID=3162487 RepID=A0ABV3QBZ3_9GAMM